MKKSLLFTFAFLLFTCVQAQARNFWVDASASGSHCVDNSTQPALGSRSQTITQGLACVGSAGTDHGGDTVHVLAGSYQESIDGITPNGTSSVSWFVLKCETRRTCTIDPASGQKGFQIANSGHYIEFRGFIIGTTGLAETRGGGAYTSASPPNDGNIHHIRIVDNAVNGYEMSFTGTDSLEVLQNDVFNHASHSGLQHGVYVSDGSTNTIIDGNLFHDNQAYGLQMYQGDNTRPWGPHTIRNNKAWNNGTPGINGSGLYVSGATDVYNNLSYSNAYYGIQTNQVSSARIYENTVYSNSQGGIANDNASGVNADCKNNLSIANGVTQVRDCATTGGNVTTGTAASHWVTPGTDFHLLTGSTARGAGVALGSPFNVDIAGIPRPQGTTGTGWDAGAYQFSSGAALPTVSITNPSADGFVVAGTPNPYPVSGTSSLP